MQDPSGTHQMTGAALPRRDFSLTGQLVGEEVMVVVCGDVDMATAPSLDRQLREAEESPARRIVLNLAGLDFMDSTGIHVLVGAQQRAEADGHQLVLVNVPQHARRLLSLTGLDARLIVR